MPSAAEVVMAAKVVISGFRCPRHNLLDAPTLLPDALFCLICNQTMRRAIVFLMASNIKKILLVKQFGARSVGVGSWGYLLVFFNCILCY